jgi:hypothetical protein
MRETMIGEVLYRRLIARKKDGRIRAALDDRLIILALSRKLMTDELPALRLLRRR